MIVVSDTSAITSLIQIDRIEVLRQLREGVSIIGLVGALIAATQKGFLSSLAGTLDDLEAKADFRIGTELRTEALRAVGEFGR